MLIPEIDKLLDADSENTQIVRRVLYDYNPNTLDIINQISIMHAIACRSYAQGIRDYFDRLNQELKSFKVSSDLELEKKLIQLTSHNNGTKFNEAFDVLYKYYSSENRGILLSSLGILYAMAIADLLRMRVTASFSYLRLQCESLALMKLMRDDPQIAYQWRKIDEDEEGIAFYRRYQRMIKSTLSSFDLKYTYEHTSGTAMHARFARISRGLQVNFSRDVDRITQEIRVLAQEFDPDEPGYFIVNVIFILQAQGRILLHLPVVCPEITDKILIETRIPDLLNAVDSLHALFTKRFPLLAERFQQIGLEKKSSQY